METERVIGSNETLPLTGQCHAEAESWHDAVGKVTVTDDGPKQAIKYHEKEIIKRSRKT